MAFQTPSPVPASRPVLRYTDSITPRRPRSRPRVTAQHEPPPPSPIPSPSTPSSSPFPASALPSPASQPPSATPPESSTPPRKSRFTRRTLLVAALAAATVSLTPAAKPSKALTLAPTPINPYARRRRERAYKEVAKKIEEKIESVAVADFKKVIETGGGGINVSYRVAGFAAFVASALSTAIVHPIDSIKTRIQARGTDLQSDKPIFDDLYTGIFSNIMKEAPNAAIYLGVYELIKNTLVNLSSTSFFHDLPLITFLVAGALGDALGSIVRVPAEIVNKRLQLGVNRDWREAFQEAFFTKSGREASLVAWNAVLLRDVPYGGLQIMIYEFGKHYLETNPQFLHGYFSHPGLMVDVLMGALAGALAAMITTPADVLVTRLSVQNPHSRPETEEQMDVWSTAKRIWHEDGLMGFFKGTLTRGVYYAPLIGLFFALYELNRGWLGNPEATLAQIMNLEHLLAADWSLFSHKISSTYQVLSPFLTSVVWFISAHMPVVLYYAPVGVSSKM